MSGVLERAKAATTLRLYDFAVNCATCYWLPGRLPRWRVARFESLSGARFFGFVVSL